MIDIKEDSFLTPQTQLNIIRRYLHILALLQHEPDEECPDRWNCSSLADLLSMDETPDEILGKDHIKNYINKYIEEQLEIDIDREKGKRYMEIAQDIDQDLLLSIAKLYSNFVIKDTTREELIARFMESNPRNALWILGRIYFAVIEKRRISITYTSNSGQIKTGWEICPYYFIFKGTNLYLAALDPATGNTLSLIADRIRDIRIHGRDMSKEWEVPPSEEIYRHSLTAFNSVSNETVNIKLKYTSSVSNSVEDTLSTLKPEIVHEGDYFTASFKIADYLYLCKQLVSYGKDVEILEPESMRNTMINMLQESLSVYRNIE